MALVEIQANGDELVMEFDDEHFAVRGINRAMVTAARDELQPLFEAGGVRAVLAKLFRPPFLQLMLHKIQNGAMSDEDYEVFDAAEDMGIYEGPPGATLY